MKGLKIYYCEKCKQKFIPIGLDYPMGVCNACIDHNTRLDTTKGIVVVSTGFIIGAVLFYMAFYFLGIWAWGVLILTYILYKIYRRFSIGVAS